MLISSPKSNVQSPKLLAKQRPHKRMDETDPATGERGPPKVIFPRILSPTSILPKHFVNLKSTAIGIKLGSAEVGRNERNTNTHRR